MYTIVNNRILSDDQPGSIRVKIYHVLQQQDIEDRERAVMEYLDVLLELSLVSSKSDEHCINDHVADQGTLEVIQDSVADISNPHFKARLYDMLQVNKKNKFANAKLAELGKGNQPLLSFYLERIIAYISESDINLECYSVTKLSGELIGLNPSAAVLDMLIQKIKDGMEEFRDNHEYRNYRHCHETLSLLIPANAHFYSTEAARSYIMEADHFSSTPNAYR